MSDFIKEIIIEDNILQGVIFSPSLNQSLAIEIDPESEGTELADFEELSSQLQRLVDYFTREKLQQLQVSVAREITESAYEQEDYTPTATDFAALEQDLNLTKIIAFPEGFAFDYSAKATYPGNLIKVQLDEDFDIADVAIYDGGGKEY